MVEHISKPLDAFQAAMKAAQIAHERALQTPEGQAELEARQQRERAEEAAKRLAAYTRRGIPEAIAEELIAGKTHRGDPLRVTEAQEITGAALAAGRRIVVLCGQLGTGKTTIACRWLHAQEDGMFIAARHLAALSPSWSEDRPQLLAIESTPTLVIDELGLEDDDARSASRILSVITQRFDRRRVTICCANISYSAFAKRYGARAESRVWEDGKFFAPKEVVRVGEQNRQRRGK
ncbi:MAG: ATP-binding protein [bacterium]|nr:ATP-binding protein [bacterium]